MTDWKKLSVEENPFNPTTNGSTSYKASDGEYVIMDSGGTLTLPEPSPNAIVAVSLSETDGEIDIQPESGLIEGTEYLTGGRDEQMIFFSDGTGWYGRQHVDQWDFKELPEDVLLDHLYLMRDEIYKVNDSTYEVVDQTDPLDVYTHLDSDGRYLYAGGVDGDVFVVDPNDLSTVETISFSNNNFSGIAVHGRTLVAGTFDDEYGIIDLDTFEVEEMFTAERPRIVSGPNYVYVLNEDGYQLNRINPATYEIVEQVDIEESIEIVGNSARCSNEFLYFSQNGDGELYQYDLDTLDLASDESSRITSSADGIFANTDPDVPHVFTAADDIRRFIEENDGGLDIDVSIDTDNSPNDLVGKPSDDEIYLVHGDGFSVFDYDLTEKITEVEVRNLDTGYHWGDGPLWYR